MQIAKECGNPCTSTRMYSVAVSRSASVCPQNSNGKAVNFSIKTVDPGSVSWKAGLQPGDRIIKVRERAFITCEKCTK